ncbi:MAG: hypothetical protein NZ554_12875 [Bryobacteraceae bacterium]|nr:hypothetical protein [Bryobacteraceae bacterium]
MAAMGGGRKASGRCRHGRARPRPRSGWRGAVRLAALAALAAGAWAQPQWYLGATAGYGLAPAATARQGGEQAETGFRPGAALGVVGGQDLYEHLSGEFRYLFRFSHLKVAQGATEVRFAGRAHLVHYDLLILARKRSDPVRPYVAVGGGVKLYQGTGEERAWQPLSRFAILTRTRQLVGMFSFGGGVRIQIGRRSWLRWELRDCLTPFPKTVIAPGRGARIEGWVHDLIPSASIGVSF